MYTVNSTCSVIGVQAHRLGSDRLTFHRERMGTLIERELRIAIHDGLRVFRVGMNPGADIWTAERIIALRDGHFPDVSLHCYLPCETQANHWPEVWREPYFALLAQADEVVVLQNRYTKGCMSQRNRVMIDDSRTLIAVHDNVADSGIVRAVSYAESKGVETIILRPLEGPDVPVGLGQAAESDQLSANKSQMSSTYSAMFSKGKSAIMRAW